jgi:hypothetical protein
MRIGSLLKEIYMPKDKATEDAIARFKKGGMSDKDIEASGIIKDYRRENPVEDAYNQGKGSIKIGEAFATKSPQKKQRAEGIMTRAFRKIGSWRNVKKPPILTQYRKYTQPTESE